MICIFKSYCNAYFIVIFLNVPTVLIVYFFFFCRRLLDTDDELSDIQSDSVPLEVRDWLASTFTRKMGMMKKKSEEKPKFRSIVHAVQAGIFVERYVKFLISQDKIRKAEAIPTLLTLWEPIYYLLRKTAS